MTETRVFSFIVRFVQPESGEQALPWHGVVRHVQSREEMRFTRVEEALQFMSRYVPLGEDEANHRVALAGEGGGAAEDQEP